MLNLGRIDSTNVKNLVVEEVERYLVDRHCGFTTKHTSIPRVEKTEETPAVTPDKSPSPLLRVKDFLFYHLFGANPILKAQLSRPVFGGVQPDVLYFYNEDVKMGFDVSPKSRQLIVDCYRQVIEAARQRGVNLVLLVACDKYDILQDYIVDNPYPAKTLNEDLMQWMAPDLDRFVFSKQVLSPYIEQGVKDVYLFNDTHWSPASSQLISAEIIKKLK